MEPESIELLLKHLQQQVDDLRLRADAATRFGNKLVGGIMVVGLILGGMQFFVSRQVALLDAVRTDQRMLVERVIVLEVSNRYERNPHPDDKEKP